MPHVPGWTWLPANRVDRAFVVLGPLVQLWIATRAGGLLPPQSLLLETLNAALDALVNHDLRAAAHALRTDLAPRRGRLNLTCLA